MALERIGGVINVWITDLKMHNSITGNTIDTSYGSNVSPVLNYKGDKSYLGNHLLILLLMVYDATGDGDLDPSSDRHLD